MVHYMTEDLYLSRIEYLWLEESETKLRPEGIYRQQRVSTVSRGNLGLEITHSV